MIIRPTLPETPNYTTPRGTIQEPQPSHEAMAGRVDFFFGPVGLG